MVLITKGPNVRAGPGYNSKLTLVIIELSPEPEASGDTTHGGGDQLVEVTLCGGCEFEGAETEIVQGLVVDAVGLICVFYKLVD